MKICFKSFVSGVIVATVGVASVFAAAGIKSAAFNSNKVVFNGTEIDLSSQPMISVVKEGETNMSNYMPVRAVLEAMGYEVTWDGTNNTVHIDTKKAEAIAEPAEPSTQPVAPSSKSTALTTDAISGTWFSDQYDMYSTMAIGKDGTIQYLITDDEGAAMYMSGKYVIKGDAIEATYDYLYDDGDAEKLTGDDIIFIDMRLRFDGADLEWWDENMPMTFSKEANAADFSQYNK